MFDGTPVKPSKREPNRPPKADAGSAKVGGPGSRPPLRRKGGDRRKPWGSSLVILLGVLLMVASGTTYYLLNDTLAKVNKSITTDNLLGTDAATGKSINGVLNILLIGVDTRPDNTIGSRSDSIIIMHVPASHDRAYLVSIPRDTYVDIPGHGMNKINAAFQYGSANKGGYKLGAQMLTATLKQDYGLTFNAAMVVNFDGFQDIVNALGGVTMYVDENTKSLHHGYKIVNGKKVNAAPFVTYNNGATWHAVPGVTPVIYTKGTHHLSAYEALDYVRIRDFLPNGDYDRERHQQQFIKAVLKEAVQKGLNDPLNADKLLSSLKNAFVFDPGTHTLDDWIFSLKGISPNSMITIQTNGGTYDSGNVNGQSIQKLSDTSEQLIQAVKDDTVDQFIQQNPSWVSNS